MKKIFFLSLLIFVTTVNASKTYLFNEKVATSKYITNNDNYNFDNYILEQNQILVVPPENGLLSNDIISGIDYIIKIEPYSTNSRVADLEYNETTGSFTYTPSDDVIGIVIYKYYIEYNDIKSNESYIYFYVKNTTAKYKINFLEKTNNKKIAPSILTKASVNQIITEKPINIDGYNLLDTKPITKKISQIEEENDFNFYYIKIPNTGI